MMNNSTNINNINNHLSFQIIEHKKKNTTNDVRNPGIGLGQAHKLAVLNLFQFVNHCPFKMKFVS